MPAPYQRAPVALTSDAKKKNLAVNLTLLLVSLVRCLCIVCVCIVFRKSQVQGPRYRCAMRPSRTYDKRHERRGRWNICHLRDCARKAVSVGKITLNFSFKVRLKEKKFAETRRANFPFLFFFFFLFPACRDSLTKLNPRDWKLFHSFISNLSAGDLTAV